MRMLAGLNVGYIPLYVRIFSVTATWSAVCLSVPISCFSESLDCRVLLLGQSAFRLADIIQWKMCLNTKVFGLENGSLQAIGMFKSRVNLWLSGKIQEIHSCKN